MSGQSSALENISNDFAWVPQFLKGLAGLVSDLGPLLALGGAIYIFFAQRENDRRREERKEKRELYAELLNQSNQVWDCITEGPHSRNTGATVIKLGLRVQQIELIAPPSIAEAAMLLRESYAELAEYVLQIDKGEWSSEVFRTDPRAEEMLEGLVESERSILDLMRSDLGEDTLAVAASRNGRVK